SVQPGVNLHPAMDQCGEDAGPCGSETCAPMGDGGACMSATAAALCALATCSGDGLHGAGPAYCMAVDASSFACPPQVAFDCTTDYRCDPGRGRCKTGCTTVDDCIPGDVCNPSGKCVPAATAFPAMVGGCALRAVSPTDGPWGRAALLLIAAL